MEAFGGKHILLSELREEEYEWPVLTVLEIGTVGSQPPFHLVWPHLETLLQTWPVSHESQEQC